MVVPKLPELVKHALLVEVDGMRRNNPYGGLVQGPPRPGITRRHSLANISDQIQNITNPVLGVIHSRSHRIFKIHISPLFLSEE
jgi:hypothetical protein